MDSDQFKKPFSAKTNELIDDEVKNLIDKSYARAIQLLTDKRELVEKLAQRLLEKETIVLKDLQDILGNRPFDLGEEMNEYIQISNEHQGLVDTLRIDCQLNEDLNNQLNTFIEKRIDEHKELFK